MQKCTGFFIFSHINTNLDTVIDIAFENSKLSYKRQELHKNNKTVYMTFNNHVSALNNKDTLAVIPSSCIPSNAFWAIPVFTGNDLRGRLECDENGNVIYYGSSITDAWILANTSWVTK